MEYLMNLKKLLLIILILGNSSQPLYCGFFSQILKKENLGLFMIAISSAVVILSCRSCTKSAVSVDEYCDRIATGPSQWGDCVTLQALANLFKTEIWVQRDNP